MKSFATILLLALLLHVVSSKKVEYVWNLNYKRVNADGLFERRVISINDEWPPKPVILNTNDTLVIHLNNFLNEPAVIHAHGINQDNGTNSMDGAGMVTQCPVPSNYNFTYEFPITQAGTFWIHSHFKVQYMDGLRVPLIVHDPNEPFEYDEDQIVVVSDWYHEDSYTNLEQYMNLKNPEGVEPIPQSGLINDDVKTAFTFKPNKVYRLRIINMSGIATFTVFIDDHNLQVIELDGERTQPTLVKSIYVAAGQRVSVLVKTKPLRNYNYLLHANMDPAMFDYIPDNLELNVTAPIYYDENHSDFYTKAATTTETHKKEITVPYTDGFIPPLIKEEPLVPNRYINMTIDFMVNTDGLNHGVINGIPYLTPLVPSLHTLVSIEKGLENNSLVYGPQSQVFMLDLDDNVQVVINNLDDGPHPFHLHGHTFQVIAKGPNVFHNNTDTYAPLYNNANPTRRDTIIVDPESYLIIRFKANNPGVWFFHCHVDWHLPAGLAATFITAPSLARDKFGPLPQAMIDVCLVGGQPATGNAAGKHGLDLDGAPDGIRPIKSSDNFMMACLVATLVGLSTLIWHIWIDPGNSEEEEEDLKNNNIQKEDKVPLLNNQEEE